MHVLGLLTTATSLEVLDGLVESTAVVFSSPSSGENVEKHFQNLQLWLQRATLPVEESDKSEKSTEDLKMSASAADVERTLTLPASPRLILLVAGDRVTIGRWMISIESHVICEGNQPSFITGLAAIFSTYYVFNLQYQDEAARILEFVQRRLIGINPERGQRPTRGRRFPRRVGSWCRRRQQRFISDNVTLIRDVLELSGSLAVETGLISIDQEKAFDRVEHQYLWQTLAAFGFSPGFIAMIRAPYSDIVNWGNSEALMVGEGLGDRLAAWWPTLEEGGLWYLGGLPGG
ncbi:uncharacterized protein LOC117820325 [Notolabrus celidotus]|uniref:uncharacterized protein LOC117820325 n=1 Tax=Notolabrus celidotus TaxID=1203425 RepID=UPI00148FF6FE|nr:uncharacterized protein LOC117820325 [Notolabrus celidotus]